MILRANVPLFSSRLSAHRHNGGLSVAAALRKRAVRRAHVGAASAFYAVHAALLLEALILARRDERLEHRRDEPHRAGLDALAAVQAGGDRLQQRGLRRQRENAGGALHDRHVDGAHRNAHHRAAGKNLHRLLLEAAAEVDKLAHRRAERHGNILRMRDGVARDRDDARHRGLAERDRAVNLLRRAHVEDDAADVGGERRHDVLLPRQRFDEHFFRALRILDGERLDGDALRAETRDGLLHRLDGGGLVVLYRDNALRLGEEAEHQPEPVDDLVRRLEHNAVVAVEIRLALDAVDDEPFNLLIGRRGQLDRRRERSAAEADYSGLADALQILLRVDVLIVRSRKGRRSRRRRSSRRSRASSCAA